jgi:hypothetical protein
LLFVLVFSRFFVPQNHSFHPPQGEQPDTRYAERKPSLGAFVRRIVCQAAKVRAVFVGPFEMRVGFTREFLLIVLPPTGFLYFFAHIMAI